MYLPKIGTKITVLNERNLDAPEFLRCYIIKTIPFIQAYDPLRNWSWGWSSPTQFNRIMFM
jgi:hypothetical protein